MIIDERMRRHCFMSLDYRASLITLLQQKFPGRFDCQADLQGKAGGLRIRRLERAGYAFVYEPNGTGHMLLALHERDDDTNPEVWTTASVGEILERLRPWAFPPAWTQPCALDREEEKIRLSKIVFALSTRDGIDCRIDEVDVKFANLMTANALRLLGADLKSLNSRRLVRNYPWDNSGRLALKTSVLLRILETETPPGKDRSVCLVASGPAKRSDPQNIRVHLSNLIVVNQSHRWEKTEWLWQERDPLDVYLQGSNRFGCEVPANCANENLNDTARAAVAMEYLDRGSIEDAFGMYGISFSEDLHRLIGGERISPPACCAHPDQQWTEMLVSTLRSSAPWLLQNAVDAEIDRLSLTVRGKKRSWKPPQLKIAIFPGQTHSRKASLILTADKGGSNLRFEIQATASNARLPDTAWKRPLEVDLLRYGIPVDYSLV